MSFTRVRPAALTDQELEEWIVDAGSGCSVPPEVFLGFLEWFRMPIAIMQAYKVRAALEKADVNSAMHQN